MRSVLINGDFFCRRLTGIERFAYEITVRLDKLCAPGALSLIVPANAPELPEFKNISVIRHNKKIRSHLWWQMITLQRFLITRRKYTVLEFGNTCLPFAPGIVFLHDIYCEYYPEDFTTLRDKIIRIYNRLQYRLIARRAKEIATVSYFSREQIARAYNVNPGRIHIIYSSADHFKDVTADYAVFDSFPELLKKEFYFSLGSLSKRKNIRWITEYAAKHPASLFVISGASLSALKTDGLDSLPDNIISAGYLSDGKVRALMERCKAFILPSYYEGFGLTALEALSAGAKIIVSRAASLPEIYGDTARYIDPYDSDADLDSLLAEEVFPPEHAIKKYSYDDSAARLMRIIGSYTK